jgi:hypothetical protein
MNPQFFFNENKTGKEAIKDIPLARCQYELVNKRCRYVDSVLPVIIVGDQKIDLREYCPMCADNKIIINNNELSLKCEDCMNISLNCS